ncbi:putative serine/threonine-protein kinase WNK2 isoform J [Glycine soja]|nr:putative serine/threonine-protein kinase WNK2 isoform H [Glycine soja]RZB75836.1 putative serine/threonine-protein kinase WNK2 isoform I [Glycine soja]RZB75837.1 putative serine/threonine-protein kinase WNK2 isoform J [Glycine soja]
MPPEYATRGNFSVKSDVFSYGVIVLEIVSGKRNRDFADSKHYNNLLGHAWTLGTEERALELLDEVLGVQCTPSEVIRCIQIHAIGIRHGKKTRTYGYLPESVLTLTGNTRVDQVWVRVFLDNQKSGAGTGMRLLDPSRPRTRPAT